MSEQDHAEETPATGAADDGRPEDVQPPSPVRVEKPPPEEDDELGGESPCQLHRFWDVPE